MPITVLAAFALSGLLIGHSLLRIAVPIFSTMNSIPIREHSLRMNAAQGVEGDVHQIRSLLVTIRHFALRGGDIFDAMIFVMRTFHLKMLCFTGLRGGPQEGGTKEELLCGLSRLFGTPLPALLPRCRWRRVQPTQPRSRRFLYISGPHEPRTDSKSGEGLATIAILSYVCFL